jgi:hypothetical protein
MRNCDVESFPPEIHCASMTPFHVDTLNPSSFLELHKVAIITPSPSCYSIQNPRLTRTTSSSQTNKTANLLPSIPRPLIYLSVLLLIMAMPNFISRLFRPFSTSTSLGLNPQSSSAISSPEGAAKATIAAGCFWGVEHMYRKEFKGKGLYDARVGYIGGDSKNPSYRSVCSGRTGRMFFAPSNCILI